VTNNAITKKSTAVFDSAFLCLKGSNPISWIEVTVFYVESPYEFGFLESSNDNTWSACDEDDNTSVIPTFDFSGNDRSISELGIANGLQYE
jgi:hypothetical protein